MHAIRERFKEPLERAAGKLKVLVRMDLEGASACIEIRGRLDQRNEPAVHSLANRVNSLAPGLEISMDLRHAVVDHLVLEHLQSCAETNSLPEYADPQQAECRLRIIPPPSTDAPAAVTLAA